MWGPLTLLWNPDTRRLRAPWRLVLAVVLLVVVSLGVSILLSRLFTSLAPASRAVTIFVGVTVQGVAIVLAVSVAIVALDRRRFGDVGLAIDRDWWLDFGFGLALGAALMTLIFVVELAAGWVRVRDLFVADGSGFALAFVLTLLGFLWVGFYEELLVRGYLLTNLAEGLSRWGTRPAVGVATLGSSAVFGLLHATNPNATLVSTLAIGLAGVLLALGYVLTGDLAIPVGLHVTWNLFQGAVFGFPVSGLRVGATVLEVSQRGPPVLTGGSFGPEAGLLGLGAMVVGAGAILVYTRYRYDTLALASGVWTPDLRWR